MAICPFRFSRFAYKAAVAYLLGPLGLLALPTQAAKFGCVQDAVLAWARTVSAPQAAGLDPTWSSRGATAAGTPEAFSNG